MKISIFILNFNNSKLTIECIDSLLKSVTNHEIFIYLLDNGSNETEVNLLKNYVSTIISPTKINFTTYYSNVNLGFSKGNNYLIRKSELDNEFDYYILLNNDTVVMENSIDNLVNFSINNNADATSGTILEYDTKDLIWYSGGHINKIRAKGVHHYYGKSFRKIKLKSKKTLFLSGCYVLFSRNCLYSLGLLNESYFFGTEEYDFSIKLRKLGFRMFFCRESIIYHKVSISKGHGSSHEVKELIFKYNSIRNKYIFLISNLTFINKSHILLIFLLLLKTIYYKNNFEILNKAYRKKLFNLFIKSFLRYSRNYYIDFSEFESVRKSFLKIYD